MRNGYILCVKNSRDQEQMPGTLEILRYFRTLNNVLRVCTRVCTQPHVPMDTACNFRVRAATYKSPELSHITGVLQ